MIKNRTGSLAAALALTAATTVTVAPAAHAAPTAPATGTATVQYVAQGTGSASGGSLDNEFVQVGLVLIAGIGISALLAIGAGVAGGGIELPEVPGLPF